MYESGVLIAWSDKMKWYDALTLSGCSRQVVLPEMWDTYIEWFSLSAGVQFTEDTRGKQGSSDGRAEDEEKPHVSVAHSVLDAHGVQDRDRQLAQGSSHGAGT